MWRAVRRFGLEYCDLATMLSNVSAMLRILALNIDGRNNKRIPIAFVILTATSAVLYIYAYVLSSFWFTFWRSRETGDLSAAFVEFSLNITSEIAVIKLFYMMFYSKRLKQLTNKYVACDAGIVKGSRYSCNMLKSLRNVKRRGIVYWMILMVDVVMYLTKPLVTPGRHLTMDAFVIYASEGLSLPVTTDAVKDPKRREQCLEPMMESPNYEMALIIMAIGVLFICYTVANVTCFIILIIGYNEAHMLSLSEEMTHLWGDAIDNYKKIANTMSDYKPSYNNKNLAKDEMLNEYLKERLIDIIERHAMTKNNLQEIEDVMRGPNAIGFLLLIVGLLAELLGGLEHTWLQLPFTMLQLSVDCYLGQKIIDSNLKFERAVYECKWEMFNHSNRKIVMMMLQNAQKTMTLSAGGMAKLSFTCLMSIIRTTYSAYTTLRSIV